MSDLAGFSKERLQRLTVCMQGYVDRGDIAGVVTLIYAIHIRNPPFILGQALPLVIYARNLWLVHREKRGAA